MKKSFFSQFFAKGDGVTTLEMHTWHVIEAGKQLLAKLPFPEDERTYWSDKLFRCAVLHDLGKIHPAFQGNLKGEQRIAIRHEIISLWFCENYLDLPEDELFAIATHHKGVVKPDGDTKNLDSNALTSHMEEHFGNSKDLLNSYTVQLWLEMFDLASLLKKERSEPPYAQISKPIQKLLRKGSQPKSLLKTEDRKKLSFMRALLIAADHIGSARMEASVPSFKKIMLSDFQPQREGHFFEFRSFQQKLLSVKGDVILHAPTGSGKTEAALCWVFANQYPNARLFYLLPYTASINAMTSRLETVFGKDRVTALHSKTLDFFYGQLAEEASNNDKVDYPALEQEAHSKKSLSQELFFPVKVTTLHQVLKTSLKGKGWELALYDYKNALFIIDEFHTYNALLTGLLLATIRLFRRLFQAKFLFMSATIPEFMLQYIVEKVFEGDHSRLIRPNPKEASDFQVLDRKRHILHMQTEKKITDDIEKIQGYLSEGKSVLVVVNNVKSAQKIFDKIGFSEKEKVAILHSGFNKKSRTEIEKRITHFDISQRPQLLIATQAVEVSLDIDYDLAFIENAPIDALIQRFGRVNRAGKKYLAPIYLYEKSMGNTKYFYDEATLVKTWKTLLTLDGQQLSEQDLVSACNTVYENGYNEPQQRDFEKGLNNSVIADFEEDWIAGDWHDWIENVMEKTNGQKVDIVCCNLIDEFEDLKEQKRYIEANQLLVQVYFYELKGTTLGKDNSGNVIVGYEFFYDEVIGYTKGQNEIFL